MQPFIKGMTLCESFFHDCAEEILARYFPDLIYTAGLLGYGSDVLGYDNVVSTDHMWGPRFYLFLRQEDMYQKEEILSVLSRCLPETYRGYSTSFTLPDANDHGVRRPTTTKDGVVMPLIWVQTWQSFLKEQIGTEDPAGMDEADWLAVSEHRLLSLTAGKLFCDGLGVERDIRALSQYPFAVRCYLIASSWDMIASEQAFTKRCGDCGDELGARMIAARTVERLMRLCFLYANTYAPYPKWFGTAFSRLAVGEQIKQTLTDVLRAHDAHDREEQMIRAQLLLCELHNESGIGTPVCVRASTYYGRDIRVIHAERLARAALDAIDGHPLSRLPLIGSLSQIGGLSAVSDEPALYARIAQLYRS